MQTLQPPTGVSAILACMERVVFICAVDGNLELNGKALHLKTAEYMVLLQMRNRELAGLPAMTRDEILERVTYESRMVDGALSRLKKLGLVERRIIFELTDQGRTKAG